MKKIISITFLVLFFAAVISGYFYYQNKKTNNMPIKQIQTNMNQNKKIKIIAIGDSLTAGYGLLESESYPTLLQDKINENFLDAQVINAGVSGETTKGLLSRIDFLSQEKGDVYIITIGGNDALRNLPIDNTEKNIEEILQSLKKVTKKENIILLKIQAPLNLGSVYRNEFNSMYENIGRKEGVRVVDFVVEEVFLNSSLMQNDGIHPNKNGYEVLVNKYIFPIVKDIIAGMNS